MSLMLHHVVAVRARSRGALLGARLPLGLVLGAVLFSCASVPRVVPDRSAIFLHDAPPPRTGCSVVLRPDPLPSVADLVDSAAFHDTVAVLAERFRTSGSEPTYALFSIGLDRSGSVARLETVVWRLHPQALEPLRSAVRRQLSGRHTRAMDLRMRVQFSPALEMKVGRAERCEPVSLVSFGIVAPVFEQLQEPGPIATRMYVSADGTVRQVDILRGSGSRELDVWVTKHLQQAKFQPGLIDGHPAAMEYEQTVRVRTR